MISDKQVEAALDVLASGLRNDRSMWQTVRAALEAGEKAAWESLANRRAGKSLPVHGEALIIIRGGVRYGLCVAEDVGDFMWADEWRPLPEAPDEQE